MYIDDTSYLRLGLLCAFFILHLMECASPSCFVARGFVLCASIQFGTELCTERLCVLNFFSLYSYLEMSNIFYGIGMVYLRYVTSK
jgi:hypothetical protein